MLNACTVNCSWFQRLLLPPLPIPALLYRITKEPKRIRKKDVIGITTKIKILITDLTFVINFF